MVLEGDFGWIFQLLKPAILDPVQEISNQAKFSRLKI
jgi:hypothetical protein